MRASRWLDVVVGLAGALATASLIAEFGVDLGATWSRWLHVGDFVIVALYLIEALVRLLFVPDPFAYLRRHAPRYLIGGWLLLALALSSNFQLQSGLAGDQALLAGKVYLVLAQGYLLLEALFTLGRIHHRLGRLHIPSVLVGPAPFLLFALIGAGLLALPTCRTEAWSFIDLLFVSTSAICVTGLSPRVVASSLTPTGQAVLMVLIQIGGLGVMTVTAFLATISGELRGHGQKILLSRLLGADSLATARRLLLTVIGVVAVVEAFGAFVLHGLAPGWSWFTAVFHSVSAFCNAGFSTLPNGYEDLTGVTGVLLPSAVLLVLGGLGFPVLLALPRKVLRGLLGAEPGWSPFERHVLLTTALLIGAGWAAFSWCGLPGSWVDHLFQAVTPRTAGFASFAQTALTPLPLAIVIVLMIIGGGPLSAAGGIKVTSVSVLAGRALTPARYAASPGLALAARLAGAAVGLYATAALAGTAVLAVVEQIPLVDAAFETVSALSTVGLDRGVTAALSPSGKAIVIVLMLAGRIGLPAVLLTRMLPRFAGQLGADAPEIPIA